MGNFRNVHIYKNNMYLNHMIFPFFNISSIIIIHNLKNIFHHNLIIYYQNSLKSL